MPLLFYGDVNLDSQSLLDTRLEVVGSAPTGVGIDYEGRIIFVQTSIDGDASLGGRIAYKNSAANDGEPYTYLDSTGLVDSISTVTGNAGGLIVYSDGNLDGIDGDTKVDINWSGSGSIVRAGGDYANADLLQALQDGLANTYILCGGSAGARKESLATLKVGMSAGVSSLVSQGPGDGDFTVNAPDHVVLAVGTVDANGLVTTEASLAAGTPSGTDAEKEALFLQATSDVGSTWANWPTYANTEYIQGVTVTSNNSINEYGRINFTSFDEYSPSSTTIDETIYIKAGGGATPKQIRILATASTAGVGTMQIKLQPILEINNLTVTTNFVNAASQTFTTVGDLATITMASLNSTSTISSPAFTNLPTISATAADYDSSPSDSMMANKAYADAAGNMIFIGEYVATSDPASGVSVLKGHSYAVTTGGSGVANFWSVPLQEGDFIICNTTTGPLNENDWSVVTSKLDWATADTPGIMSFPFQTGNGGWENSANWADPSKPEVASNNTTSDWPLAGNTTKSPVITSNQFGKITTVTKPTIQLPGSGLTILDHIPLFNNEIQTKHNEISHYATVPSEGGSWDIAHGLNTLDVMVQVFLVSTGATVFAEATRTSNANVTIGVNGAASATTGQFGVLLSEVV